MRDIVYSEKERAWLWLNRVIGANVQMAEALLKLGSPVELRARAINGEPISFPEGMSPDDGELLLSSAGDDSIDRYIEWLTAKGIYAVTRDSEDYPDLLREIFDPPTVLYVIGRLQRQAALPIAVIGSRKCSDYGIEMAEHFGLELAKHGACVVSGLAVGCDAAASRGALSVKTSDYPTVAVLGSGVNVIYPAKNKKLYEAISERGAVISEFLPNMHPNKFSFPQRNRIISGLSRGVLVVEAGASSGTSITVDFALEHGRDVFAVPGRITDPMSRGTNNLIKRGEAKAVFDIEDILSEYGVEVMSNAASPIKLVDTAKLSPRQALLYNTLLIGEKNIDELCQTTGFTVSELNILLTEMELSGIIKQLPNKLYSI